MHKAPSTTAVHKMLRDLVASQAEGIVARRPHSLYVHGRTSSALKFKTHKDQEALVTEIEQDAYGQISCVLKLNNDTTIKAQYSSTQNPTEDPRSGDIVTFNYNIVNSQGIPANATVLRVRRDLTWEHVLGSITREAELNDQAESALIKRSKKVAGYWTVEDSKNIRLFLNEFAHSRNFDPLVPQNWLDVTTRDIIAAGGVGFLSSYKGSLTKCLVDVYPEIGMRITNRNKLPQRYWKEYENRKQVFDNLAKKMKFDPLIQKNWYWITRQQIVSEKGGSSVLDHYAGSIGNALKDIYPTVQWHEPNFFRKYWHEPLNRRKFFDSYAAAMAFDPLVASNWFSVTTESVVKHPGGHAVMDFYRSLQSALQDLYPQLKLEDWDFKRMRSGYWTSFTKRDFFDRFARERGFEPLIAANWYNITLENVTAAKGGYSAIRGYGGSVMKAVMDLYPDISHDSSLFRAVPMRHWKSAANRRVLLEWVALQRGLDPLRADSWDHPNITAADIKKVSGGRHLLKETKGLRNALAQSFPEMKAKLESQQTKTKTHTKSPSIWDRISAHKNTMQ